MIVLFDYKAVVHHEYALPGQRVNGVLTWYVAAFAGCCLPELHASGDWHLHHVNALVHSAQFVWQFLVKYVISQVCQIRYSPDNAIFYTFLKSLPTWKENVSRFWGNPRECGKPVVYYPKKEVPGMLLSKKMMLGKIKWLQKWTDSKEIKYPIDTYCSFIFIATVLILFRLNFLYICYH